MSCAGDADSQVPPSNKEEVKEEEREECDGGAAGGTVEAMEDSHVTSVPSGKLLYLKLSNFLCSAMFSMHIDQNILVTSIPNTTLKQNTHNSHAGILLPLHNRAYGVTSLLRSYLPHNIGLINEVIVYVV